MGKGEEDEGYFGFKIQPYCSSTQSYCNANAQSINDGFLTFMNTSIIYLCLPENRFEPENKKLMNNIIINNVNMNLRFMKDTSAFE